MVHTKKNIDIKMELANKETQNHRRRSATLKCLVILSKFKRFCGACGNKGLISAHFDLLSYMVVTIGIFVSVRVKESAICYSIEAFHDVSELKEESSNQRNEVFDQLMFGTSSRRNGVIDYDDGWCRAADNLEIGTWLKIVRSDSLVNENNGKDAVRESDQAYNDEFAVREIPKTENWRITWHQTRWNF